MSLGYKTVNLDEFSEHYGEESGVILTHFENKKKESRENDNSVHEVSRENGKYLHDGLQSRENPNFVHGDLRSSRKRSFCTQRNLEEQIMSKCVQKLLLFYPSF